MESYYQGYGGEQQGGAYPQPPTHPFMPMRPIFDGKRMRKPIQRKTIDFNSSIMKFVEVNFSE